MGPSCRLGFREEWTPSKAGRIVGRIAARLAKTEGVKRTEDGPIQRLDPGKTSLGSTTPGGTKRWRFRSTWRLDLNCLRCPESLEQALKGIAEDEED